MVPDVPFQFLEAIVENAWRGMVRKEAICVAGGYHEILSNPAFVGERDYTPQPAEVVEIRVEYQAVSRELFHDDGSGKQSSCFSTAYQCNACGVVRVGCETELLPQIESLAVVDDDDFDHQSLPHEFLITTVFVEYAASAFD